MHELSFAEAIQSTLAELPLDGRRVRRVVLSVGRMRQVDPELLEFAFGVASRGTPSEGAVLSILPARSDMDMVIESVEVED
ncbi:MAG: hydrogenase maturation nickel metallochaperone HypA [Synergistaceae bacterium]|jgi:Zn finger protein HypA/HybF involved in hydrogenase expression|nr:hydrogenase maturation nickel metallochaperone HypA [Synergistaceae bacterium]